MGNYHLFILGSICVVSLIVVILIARNKKAFRSMQGMIISMFFGMNVGLTAGVLFGATYQGHLFLSTLLSMSVGVFAGSLCGLCLGILPIIEGLMAGLMGGMMGAMIGEMLPVGESIHLLQIFLFLCVCTIFLIAILGTPKNAKVNERKWLLKPLAFFIFAASLIIGSNSIVEKDEIQNETDRTEKHHAGTINSPTDNEMHKF